MADRQLPDKAIDIIDEAGASFRVNERDKSNVSRKDIEHIIAKIAKQQVASTTKKEKNGTSRHKYRRLSPLV